MAQLNRRIVADQGPLARLGNTGYARIAFYDKMVDYHSNPRRTFDCFSGTHSFFLAHDGEVYPCINLAESMGNVRRQKFDDIWFSAQASEVREPIAAWKCHCWTNCETELSLARRPSAFLSGVAANLRNLAR